MSKKKSAVGIGSTFEFMNEDFGRTLFPLYTNLVLARHAESELLAYISECLDEKKKEKQFLPQQRVYAAKPKKHLRRTVKLDPVSEFYLYDVVFKNRKVFKKPHTKNREHFGYRFEEGASLNPSLSYRAFKGAISDYKSKYQYFIAFDVASYFNSIYHHDLVNWFRNSGASESDVNGFGQMLREINSGRSIDFLPQGVYPSKMIGNDFLRFVDNHYSLKSSKLIRFMDDFYIFSDSEADLEYDFLLIQELLGARGLSVNPQKTSREIAGHTDMDHEMDEIKRKLLERRRIVVSKSYGDTTEARELMLQDPLDDEELDYISEIIHQPHLEEDDAELILTIMQDNTDQVEDRLSEIAMLFPNLAKNLHSFCAQVEDKDLIAEAVVQTISGAPRPLEFQLFWSARILEDYLLDTDHAPRIIEMLLNSQFATPITKAKVLEICDSRFGLAEAREQHLRDGASTWTSWASAIGSLSLEQGSRNHVLKYFGNASQINHLISSTVSQLPKMNAKDAKVV